MDEKLIRCDMCYLLEGSNVFLLDDTSTALERANEHCDIHRRQIRFIDDASKGIEVKMITQTVDIEERKKTTKKKHLGRPTGFRMPKAPKPPPPPKEPRRSTKPPPPPPPPPVVYTNRLDTRCYELLNAARDGRNVKCQECDGFITIVQKRDQVEIESALHHVYKMHLKSYVYSCAQCEYRTESEASMRKHLDTEHKLPGRKENYKISSAKSEDEVIARVERCFSKKENSTTTNAAVVESTNKNGAGS